MRRISDDIDNMLSSAPPARGTWHVPHGSPRGPSTWRLKRNCALRPLQYLGAMGFLMSLSAVVAAACWIRGIWLVPLFCGIELLGIAAAAIAYARHAVDGEIVQLTGDGRVRVEVDRGLRHTAYLFLTNQVRLIRPTDAPDTLWLHHGATRIELASYASPATRDAFENELRQAIRDITT
jgi:uncharacterized membrane protein